MKSRISLVALVCTLIGVFCLALYQRRYVATSSGGEKVKLLIAAKQIDRGTVVLDDMLEVREMPMAYVEDRAIKEAERPKVLGLRVLTRIQPDETLMWTDLTSGDAQQPLSNSIQPGARALTIRTSREDSNAPLIRPGDYVDVVSVIPDGTTDKADDNEGRASVVLLQRVFVLASGLNVSAQEPSDLAGANLDRAESTLLTLSVTLQEAQVLALAAERGHLSCVLRPVNDPRTMASVPDLISDELFDPKMRAARATRRDSAGPGLLK